MNRAERRHAEEVTQKEKDGRMYVDLVLEDGRRVEARVGKLVWTMYVDNTLDLADDSWELGYKDGNFKNCAVDNLYRVK